MFDVYKLIFFKKEKIISKDMENKIRIVSLLLLHHVITYVFFFWLPKGIPTRVSSETNPSLFWSPM